MINKVKVFAGFPGYPVFGEFERPIENEGRW